MNHKSTPSAGQDPGSDELATIRNLHQAAAVSGVQVTRKAISNIYVSLKSRPYLILTGESQTGKIEMLKCLGHVLTENPTLQCQFLVGHARWAAQSQDVSRFVEMQARFNRSNLLALFEEATLPENVNRLFVACLIRISPAELYTYFTTRTFQFWPDQARIAGAQAALPIPYPPNFRLIGTMDTGAFDWWEADLLAQTTVVDWRGENLDNTLGDERQMPTFHPNFNFLQTCIHSELTAYAHLRRNLAGERQAFLPLLQVRDLLHQHNITLPQKVIGGVIRYLANSWVRFWMAKSTWTKRSRYTKRCLRNAAQGISCFAGRNGRCPDCRCHCSRWLWLLSPCRRY